MKPGADFEELVADVIGHLRIFSSKKQGSHVSLFRNKKYPGAKDPAGYEIDISLELSLPPGLRILLIVECKAHERLVERSVVQQFLQVRDDISAHKAIIVSSNGFNEGAVRLAQKSGVALWQYVDYELLSVVEMEAAGGAHKSDRSVEVPFVKVCQSFFDRGGISVDVDALIKETEPLRSGRGPVQVHFSYSLSNRGLEVVPSWGARGLGMWRIPLSPYDAPRPKGNVLDWIVTALAAQSAPSADYFNERGFHLKLPNPKDLVEYETLLDAAERLNSMDLRPRKR